MVDVWPATLPQYLLAEGFAQAFGDGRLRTRTDTGPAKARGRSSAMPAPLQGQMIMDGDQFATFCTFVTTTLGKGVLPFMFPDPVTGDPILIRIGENMPRWTSKGADNWLVSLDLEVLP